MDTGKIIGVNFKNGHYYIRLKELKDAGLLIPNQIKIFKVFAIDQLKHVHVQYDIQSQRLLINVPYFWFPNQKIFFNNQNNLPEKNIPSQSNFGWLLNYNFYYHKQLSSYNQIGSVNFWSELRIFSKWGVLSNTSSWSNKLSKPSYIRYDTHFDINDEKHLVSYIIGDTTTDMLFGSIPLKIGGIKFFRNFSLSPDVITYPLPNFYGQTFEPSKIDLYINHSKMMSTKINPGPFTIIDTIPNLQGASKAKIVIISQKNKKVSIIPFYVTSELLKPGLTNFSLSLGLLRKNYGINSMDYSHLITSGIIRHGIKSWLTLEGQMQGSRHFLNYGLGADIKPMRLGVVKISWMGSNYNINSYFHKSSSFLIQKNMNQKITIGYNYNNTYFSLNALHSSNYKSLTANSHENNLTGSINFGNYGNFSLGLIKTWNNNGNTNRLINLSYSVTLPKSITLWTFLRQNKNHHSLNAQFMLTLPLKSWGNNGNTSFSSNIDKNDHLNLRQIWSNKITSNDHGEIAWNIIISQNGKYNRYHEANFIWKNPYFENRLGIFGDLYTNPNTWIELEGSVVNMAGHIYLTQPIHDAFALISTKGYSNIPVYYENQFVGKTNKFGHLLVPTVTGLYRSRFDIDPIKLPIDVIPAETTKKLPIKEHSGCLIEFNLHKLHALLFQVVDKKGNFFPSGSLVQVKGTSKITWLGWDGQVWLEGEGIKKSSELIVTRLDNGKTCNVKLKTKRSNGIFNLGKQVCQ
ncbi:MAG: fimbria/pilus outer membrane usher protein [Candidatus Dasytiphilus stammeri]